MRQKYCNGENRKVVELYTPTLDDMWFRKECMEDPKTMSYNAGYAVNFDGYNKETGCISFPKEKWENWIATQLSDKNFFYAFIKDLQLNKFVGYVNFKKNPNTGYASMGIVIRDDFRGQGYMRPAMVQLIEKAKQHDVKYLTDNVPQNRTNALNTFYSLGFEKIGECKSKKFVNEEIVAKIQKQIIL